MAKILVVIAPEFFQDTELFWTRSEIEKARHTVVIASSVKGRCKGALGGVVESVIALKDVRAVDFDGIVFIGGGGCEVFFDDVHALKIIRDMFVKGKVVAAICLAPVILANAGVLNGRNATVWPSEVKAIESKGANYAGRGVVIDGRIVTGDGPKCAVEFGKKICGLL